MSIRFNYETFFNHWSNFTDTCTSKQTCYFYLRTPHVNQRPIQKQLPSKYVNIDGIKVYVQKLGINELIFTTPIEIDGIMWDFHYHFGLVYNFIDKQSPTKETITAVFFHQTMQYPKGHYPYDPQAEGKYHKNCYFKDNESLDNIESIVCRERKSYGTLSSTFPNEIQVIKDIIMLPFTKLGGSHLHYILGRKRKITKVGRKSMITYKCKLISLTEARAIEKKLAQKKSMKH